MHLTPEFERDILKLSNARNANLLSYKNAHAFFPGKKTVDGKLTDDPCIVVAVTKKMPENELVPGSVIPTSLSGNIKTDVVELPSIQATGWCGGPNPIPPVNRTPNVCLDHIYDNTTGLPYTSIPGGISIGNAGLPDAGTLGLLVRDRGSRRIVGLTCNHTVGLQPYHPGPHHPVAEYTIDDNGFTFTVSDGVDTYVEGSFDNIQFPQLVAGNLYKFTNNSWLHDMYISTENTKVNGGGSFDPYLNITIYDITGNIRYSRGTGTGSPAISAGESMFLTPSTKLTQSSLHYGSWVYPNIGAEMQLVFMGVPPCKSSNRKHFPGTEYTDGMLLDRYKNLRNNKLGHPGNIDAGLGGTGQVIVGSVGKIAPIKFCDPRNTKQPVNTIDACTIELNTGVIQAQSGVLNLSKLPVVASESWAGGEVFKSGRTTGVTPSGAIAAPDGTVSGYNNSCQIISTSTTISVNYCDTHTNTIQGTAIFEDVLLYELNNEWFSDAGDSGSALMIKDTADGDKLKLTGLHFASGYDDTDGDLIADVPIRNIGIGCRIQNVFVDLDLTTWEGTIILPMDDPCIKLNSVCYNRDAQAYTIPPTHYYVDETFDDCTKCEND